jgi:predicted Zn-dependent protease
MQRVLRRSWSRLSLLCVGLAGLAGCGSDGASRKEPGPAAGLASTERPYRPGQMPVARDEEREADGLAVEGEHGTLEQRDVDARSWPVTTARGKPASTPRAR